MFDLETFLKRNGVDERCAHNLTNVFGFISQATLLKGRQDQGHFILPNMSIDYDSFTYKTKCDEANGEFTAYKDIKSVLKYDGKTGEMTLGMFYRDFGGNNNPNIKFIKIPKYGTFENAKVLTYNSETVNDFLEVMRSNIQVYDGSSDDIIIDNLLTNQGLFDEYYYIPDKVSDFARDLNYDSVICDMNGIISNPTALIEEKDYPYFSLQKESGMRIR